MKKISLICMIVVILLSSCRTSTASYNYEAAKVHFSQKNYKKALECINNSINSAEKAEYYIFQGEIYHKLKDYNKAIEVFDKAITTKNDVRSLENNKQAYKKKAFVYIDSKKFDLAGECIDKALEIKVLDEMTKELLLYKMDILLYTKQYKKTVEYGEKFISVYTTSKDKGLAFAKMGRAYGYVLNKEKALSYYELALKEKEYTTYYYRAQSYEAFGDYMKAYEDYEQFLKQSKGEVKYSIYTKQIDCLFKLVEKTADDEVFKKLEKTVNAGMTAQDEKYIKLFGKKYIALLEREGKFEEAYVYAKEYLAEYPDDKAIQKEITFLETRVLIDN